VTWAPAAGTPRWLALDAKYRTGRANLADAFTSVHLYRDALRWPEFGGAAAGAWLLAPARSPDAALWFDEGFCRAHGLGVLRLAPGDEGDAIRVMDLLDTALGLG
jgi:hypothetical protein